MKDGIIEIQFSQADRYWLHLIINPMPHPSRDERLRYDKLWDHLNLTEVSELAQGTKLDTDLSVVELTPKQVDMIIKALAQPGITTALGRALKRLENECIDARKNNDGE